MELSNARFDGRFTATLPAVKSITRNWSNDCCELIRCNCRGVLSDAMLAIVDLSMPELVRTHPEDQPCVMNDLNMLHGSGGCERTEAECRRFCHPAGFASVRLVWMRLRIHPNEMAWMFGRTAIIFQGAQPLMTKVVAQCHKRRHRRPSEEPADLRDRHVPARWISNQRWVTGLLGTFTQ
jgi:hypothetical protein